MNFLENVNKNKDEMIKTLKELLQIESVRVDDLDNPEAPFGPGIRESLDYCLELGEKMGFKVVNVDNVAGHLEYGEGDEILGILCHLDVVPAGSGWTYPPFSATEVDGKIYARGAIDDKGPTISAIYALKIIKDLGIIPNKRIRIILGTDEETGWFCIKRYLEKYEMPTIGFAPDADFPLIYGEKGIMSINLRAEFSSELIISFESGERLNVVPDFARAIITKDLTNEFNMYLEKQKLEGEINKLSEGYELIIHGVSAHAMQPEKGVNAGLKLAEFLAKFEKHQSFKFLAEKLNDTRFKSLGLNFTDPEMGDLTVNAGVIKFKNNQLHIGLNLRYPNNWDKESFINNINKELKNNSLSFEIIRDTKVHYVDKDDDFIKTLHEAYIQYTGDDKSPLVTIGGGTYARALKKAVAFGMSFPGSEDVVHQVNEYIKIDDLITATAIYASAIYNLVK